MQIKDYLFGGTASFVGLFTAVEVATLEGLTGGMMLPAVVGGLGAGISIVSMWRGKNGS